MTLDRLQALIRSLPTSVRFGVPVLLGLLVCCSIGFGIVTHQARTSLFASPLQSEQIAEVEERLAEWNVPYLEGTGNVLVDSSRRNDLLLRLSLAGVPHAHVATTSEALANVGVLTPEAVIDAQTRAGLAGDIEVALRGVDGIDDARVIIAPAKAAQFADESAHEATASVRLRLHPGAQLQSNAVEGIRSFVAASVPALDASRVTILDDRGYSLGPGAASGEDAGELQRSLQSALDATLGSGITVVRVRTEYDGSTTERREIRRAPLGGSPIARQNTGEAYVEPGKRYEKHDVRDDGGSDTREIVSRSGAGTLVRLSTAVYVDRARIADLASIRALAAATVGFQERRGDTLVVQAVDFSHRVVSKRDGWWFAFNAIAALLPTLAFVGGAIVLTRLAMPNLLGIVRHYLDRSAIARTSRTVAGYAPAQVRGALAHEPPHAAAAIISALPAATAAAVLELYPQHEREAIVRRMQRASSTLIPSVEELLTRHV